MLQEQVAAAVLTMATAKRKHVRSHTEVVIPEKIYFRIGEVSLLAKLPSYVLRFWETEFPQLKPMKSSTGQRMYRRRDVEYVVQIRKLLYEDGFTIAGAREKLREETRSSRLQKQLAPQLLSASSDQNLSGTLNQAQTGAQAALPFPPQANGVQRKEKLRHVRQQLREVLTLLS